jgi:hypothetical protein
MSFFVKDVSRFIPTNTYYIEVDLSDNTWFKSSSGVKLYMPEDEGDIYQSKPFMGKLVAAPAKSTIPIGETVYVMYQAYDTLTRLNDKDFYVVTEDLIVGYGDIDNIQAYKCVLIDVEEEEHKKLTFDVSDDDYMDAITGKPVKRTPTHKAKVLSVDDSSVEFELKRGDSIEYVGGVDWEFFVNRTKKYFIRWTDRIIKRNGELVNGYVQIMHKPKYINRGGILITNDDPTYTVVDGKFSGKRVYLESKRIELSSYIKTDYILMYEE